MAKFNIVIATHGRFGEELVKSAEMITGKDGERTGAVPAADHVF